MYTVHRRNSNGLTGWYQESGFRKKAKSATRSCAGSGSDLWKLCTVPAWQVVVFFFFFFFLRHVRIIPLFIGRLIS